MARKLSRRSLALYVADNLASTRRGDIIQQLAAYLVENRRTKELELIMRDVAFYLAQRGTVNATVITASELTAETQRAVEAFIAQQTGASQVSINSEIDPSVLGGLRISLPGQDFDQTIARQLTVLKTRFKKA
jgi:F0F1-type ATP synthase delta subunit